MELPLKAEAVDQTGRAGARTSEEARPQRIFEYGNLRPDGPDSAGLSSAGSVSTRAWLRGGRLYSFNSGGVEHAAVKLEEPGYAVLGYVMAPRDNGISSLLEESEKKQYFPQLYERDIVEVVTEAGEQVKAFVYHRPDVNRANPVATGDWCSRPTQQ